MNPQETQQFVARDEKWVPLYERVKISSTNIRLETTVPQKEETFQVYTIKKVQDINSYEFLLANKKCTVNAKVFRTILNICLRVEGVDFTNVPDNDVALTFLIDLGYKDPLNRHTNMFVDHMHQPWRTLAAIINKCKDYQEYRLFIPDVTLTDVIKHSESYQMFIKYLTHQIPPKKSKGKGSKGKKTAEESQEIIDKVTLLADDNIIAALELAKSISQTEAEATRKVHVTHAKIVIESVSESAKKNSSGRSSKSIIIQDTPSTLKSKPATSKTKLIVVSATSSEGTGAKPGVQDEDKDITEEKDDKDDDADDEGDDYVSDTQDADDEDDKTKSDEDEIYKYKIRVRKDEDVEMKDAKVEEYDKVSTVKDSTDADVSSLLDIPIQHKTPHTHYLDTKVGDVFQKELPKHTTDLVHKYSLQHLPELIKKPTPTAEQESKKSPSDILKIKKEQAKKQKKPQFTIKNPANHRLYHALMKALIEDENVMDKGVADIVKDHKRKHDDDEDDDDKDPLAGPNQGKKTKRKRTKESESLKKPSTTKDTSKGEALIKGSKTSKSGSVKEPVEEPIAEVVMDEAGNDVARDDNQPQETSEPIARKTMNPECFKQPPRPPTPDLKWNKHRVVLDQPAQPCIEVEYNFQECFNALTDNLDWNNPEGDHYLFLMAIMATWLLAQKPLPLQGSPCYRTIAADYFFNNDLEYLKTFDPEVTYTTSITKIKATRNKIKGIKDMVPTLWSTIKRAYEKYAEKGIKHWGERRKLWYQSQISKFSKQNVYSTKAILEDDFVDLHLNDIQDMLLLAVQHKLFHLDGNVIVDFMVALCMFTRSLILKRRVKDLQLGVESYQNKLNITKPQKTFLEIEFKKPYTPSYDPPGIVYKDMDKQKRVLRADELYKFLDGTLKSARDKIHHRVLNFHLDYNPKMLKRKWMDFD
uniref:Uncharacterized protein n=1 Tax=Tanacetum cinerariifolium TaxID=118510 RepID=A0A699I721_TANCI|nr:hypothetical protein [Tanacetum cinerariifolium]